MKKWRLMSGVVLVFVLGLLVGSVGTQLYHRYQIGHSWKDPAARRALFLQKLTGKLHLTEEQQREFKVIIEDLDKKREALNRERRVEINKIFDESFSRMNEKLAPEQHKSLEELKTSYEKRAKDRKRWR